MNIFLKFLRGVFIVLRSSFLVFTIIFPIIGLLIIASGKTSSNGGSWKQKNERYKREIGKRLNEEKQQKREIQEFLKQEKMVIRQLQNAPIDQLQKLHLNLEYPENHQEKYEKLWEECIDLESALNDAGIDHDAIYDLIDYEDLKKLRDTYQSLLEENNSDLEEETSEY